MEEKKQPKKTKIVVGTILFLLSLVAVGLAAYCYGNTSKFEGRELANLKKNGLFFVIGAIVLMIVSHIMVKNYRKQNPQEGGFSMAIYVLTFVQFWVVLGIFMVVAYIWTAFKNAPKAEGPHTVEAKDEDGNWWVTEDSGKTFRRD